MFPKRIGAEKTKVIQDSAPSQSKADETLQKPVSRCKYLANCKSILNAQYVCAQVSTSYDVNYFFPGHRY